MVDRAHPAKIPVGSSSTGSPGGLTPELPDHVKARLTFERRANEQRLKRLGKPPAPVSAINVAGKGIVDDLHMTRTLRARGIIAAQESVLVHHLLHHEKLPQPLPKDYDHMRHCVIVTVDRLITIDDGKISQEFWHCQVDQVKRASQTDSNDGSLASLSIRLSDGSDHLLQLFSEQAAGFFANALTYFSRRAAYKSAIAAFDRASSADLLMSFHEKQLREWTAVAKNLLCQVLFQPDYMESYTDLAKTLVVQLQSGMAEYGVDRIALQDLRLPQTPDESPEVVIAPVNRALDTKKNTAAQSAPPTPACDSRPRLSSADAADVVADDFVAVESPNRKLSSDSSASSHSDRSPAMPKSHATDAHVTAHKKPHAPSTPSAPKKIVNLPDSQFLVDVEWNAKSSALVLEVHGKKYGFNFLLYVSVTHLRVKGSMRFKSVTGQDGRPPVIELAFTKLPVYEFDMETRAQAGGMQLPFQDTIRKKLKEQIVIAVDWYLNATMVLPHWYPVVSQDPVWNPHARLYRTLSRWQSISMYPFGLKQQVHDAEASASTTHDDAKKDVGLDAGAAAQMQAKSIPHDKRDWHMVAQAISILKATQTELERTQRRCRSELEQLQEMVMRAHISGHNDTEFLHLFPVEKAAPTVPKQ